MAKKTNVNSQEVFIMADKGYCIITARKEVPTREDARAIYDLVKSKFADRPDIVITGHFSNHFDLEQEPPA